MRSTLLLLSLAACAAGNATKSFRVRTARTELVGPMFQEMVAATATHEKVALVDPQKGTIVTGSKDVDGTRAMYVVRLEVAGSPTECRWTCAPPHLQVSVAPVAFHGTKAIADEDIPLAVREHVADILWDIRERLQADGITH